MACDYCGNPGRKCNPGCPGPCCNSPGDINPSRLRRRKKRQRSGDTTEPTIPPGPGKAQEDDCWKCCGAKVIPNPNGRRPAFIQCPVCRDTGKMPKKR